MIEDYYAWYLSVPEMKQMREMERKKNLWNPNDNTKQNRSISNSE